MLRGHVGWRITRFLTRREAIAGSAAALSMLAAPGVVALAAEGKAPDVVDGPRIFLNVPPVKPPLHILDPASLNVPPNAFFTLYKNDFGDGRIHHDGNAVPLNRLVWAYESYNHCFSPFSLRDAWMLFEAASLTSSGDENHGSYMSELMGDIRDRFFVPEHIATYLRVYPHEKVLFEKSESSITFTSYGSSAYGEPSGMFKINRAVAWTSANALCI